jgi:hypothetical protein
VTETLGFMPTDWTNRATGIVGIDRPENRKQENKMSRLIFYLEMEMAVLRTN